MPDHAADDIRAKAKLLLIAGIATDLAACVALALPFVNNTDVMQALPVAIPLFLLAGALLTGWILLLRRADMASGAASDDS